MCQFFSFATDPVGHPAEYYHFDWEYRKAHLDDDGDDGADSHSHICAHFALDEDRCNKYEFNPLTKAFKTDQINSERDDSEAEEKKAGVLSAGLSCTDDRTGTVSFRHLPGDQVGSGFFVLNDGAKGHIIFVSKDGKSFKGKLEPPRRRPEFFIPPTG